MEALKENTILSLQSEISSENCPEISILMPCLNEAESLAFCINKARSFLERHRIKGEIVIADNGSTDGSQHIAQTLGARVVAISQRGYGSALMGGIQAARGRYIVMGDADDSYDFSNLMPFLDRLREGYDLVMGNRFRGGIEPGAMKPLHRYLGNPVLTWLGRLFFGSPCRDFHCGLRAFTKQAAMKMGLRTTGMEFASEMVVKATILRMNITEVPTTLAPDKRSRPPHLRSWHDGWRHLQFLLLYSPRWLFLYPGALLMLLGIFLGAWLLPGPRALGPLNLDVHTLLYAAVFVILGFQTISFALFSEMFAIAEGLLPPNYRLGSWAKRLKLEHGILIGLALITAGTAGSAAAVRVWHLEHFGELDPRLMLRAVIPSVVALTLGVQVIFSSFFLSVLRLRPSRVESIL